MRRRRIAVVLTLGLVGWAGCATKFKTLPNQPLSPALASRAQLKNYATYQDHLDELVGHVLYVTKKNGQCPDSQERVFDAINVSRKAYLLKDTKLKPKALSRVMYEARMERGTDHEGTFGFGAVSFGAARAVEFIVTDTMELSAGARLDNTALDDLAKSPLPADVCARFIIRGAILSVVNYRAYTRVESKYKVSGTAFGLGGKVYHSDSRFQPGFILGLEIGVLRNERSPHALKAVKTSDMTPVILVVPDGGFPKRD
jgi:hypothetical protein